MSDFFLDLYFDSNHCGSDSLLRAHLKFYFLPISFQTDLDVLSLLVVSYRLIILWESSQMPIDMFDDGTYSLSLLCYLSSVLFISSPFQCEFQLPHRARNEPAYGRYKSHSPSRISNFPPFFNLVRYTTAKYQDTHL